VLGRKGSSRAENRVNDLEKASSDVTRFDGPGIQANSMGLAVIQNLKMAEHLVGGFTTSAQSKPRIIAGLAAMIEAQELKYNPEEVPQLHRELLAYALPDEYLVQDSVMSLSIAVEAIGKSYEAQLGQIVAVIRA
jgi:hypothetical protein